MKWFELSHAFNLEYKLRTHLQLSCRDAPRTGKCMMDKVLWDLAANQAARQRDPTWVAAAFIVVQRSPGACVMREICGCAGAQDRTRLLFRYVHQIGNAPARLALQRYDYGYG